MKMKMPLSLRMAGLAATGMVLWGPARSFAAIGTRTVTSALSGPLFGTPAPGDANHLFIAQQGSSGTALIRRVDINSGTIDSTPFLTLTGLATGGEQGLLGLAFDPGYATNGTFYVDVTTPGGTFGQGQTVIRQYTVSGGVAGTPRDILSFSQPQNNHNGGWIGFSPRAGDSGNLYIATGDGGNANDQGTGHTEPGGNAQDTTAYLGKMLRIHVTPGSSTYTIPSDNPFPTDANVTKQAVYQYGLRNPFRDSFDRGDSITQAGKGNFYIADVGQDNREEVNIQPAGSAGGQNYGWRLREGDIATPTGGVGGAKPAGAVDPLLVYDHSVGQAIIGGYVYRGANVPELQGKYIFGDEVAQKVFSATYNGTTLTNFINITAQVQPAGGTIGSITSFAEDASGELYIIDQQGHLYQIVPEPSVALLIPVGLLLVRRRRQVA